MKREYYTKDSKRFWQAHEKARESMDKRLANLPFSKKVAIVDRMREDRASLANAKKIT